MQISTQNISQYKINKHHLKLLKIYEKLET